MATSTSVIKPQYDFDYPDFSSVAGLVLRGHAQQVENFLRVTRSTGNQGGAAWYERLMNVAEGFTTTFTFSITERAGFVGNGGDGFSFNVHTIGFDTIVGEQGTANQLSIQFDTFQNAGDPSDNFVRINYLYQVVAECNLYELDTPINIKDDNRHSVEIALIDAKLIVILDGISVASAKVSCAQFSPAIVGFGARSGHAWENHDIHSWQFTAGGPRRA
ncbi:MAG TPA: hypothetical protein VF546_06185 [Pyrinomonadaceae bacterium]|jgi:hypothetical protein